MSSPAKAMVSQSVVCSPAQQNLCSLSIVTCWSIETAGRKGVLKTKMSSESIFDYGKRVNLSRTHYT